MSPRDTSDRPKLKDWGVGALRLTAFRDPLAPAEALAEGKKWEQLVGTPPENVLARTFGTEHEENGPFGAAGRLIHKTGPHGSIEWSLEPAPDPDKLESFFWMDSSAIKPFAELMRRWLIDCPPLQRLAFGGAFYLPVKDRPEAYRRLEDLLHLGLKYSDEEGDFLYQYNRRRPSQSMPEVKINRLSKWSWVPLELRPRDGDPLVPPIRREVCLLELDINTVREYQGTLPRARLVPLFDELVAFAEEIVMKGDVP